MADEGEDYSVGIPYGDLDGNIIASSEYGVNFSVLGCKLGKDRPHPDHMAAWCAKSEDKNPWIQVKFPIPLCLNRVVTQGRGDKNQYVTRYRVLVSQDGINFIHTCEFPGNSDNTTPVPRKFPIPVRALYARIQILEYFNHPSMRFDFRYIPV